MRISDQKTTTVIRKEEHMREKREGAIMKVEERRGSKSHKNNN